MTRDEIMALDGVELDAACAEHVMDFPHEVRADGCYLHLVSPDVMQFRPSIDMNDAMRLLDGLDFAIDGWAETGPGIGNRVRVRVWRATDSGNRDGGACADDDRDHLARCIARATLLWAVEQEKRNA